MKQTSRFSGTGLEFREAMAGTVGGRPLSFEVSIRIPDLARFFDDPEHRAELTGTVTCPGLGSAIPVHDGVFQLFVVDAQTGTRQLCYQFRFTTGTGSTCFLCGHKDIRDDPGLDVVADMTCLHTSVYSGDNQDAPLYAAGDLYFKLSDLGALVGSLHVTGAGTWIDHLAARVAFASFAWGELRNEYLEKIRLFYDTRYDNLVLSGRLWTGAGERSFFLVSGVHDKGFPWGDDELFWDVLLAVEDNQGRYQRFAITDRVLEGLHLNIDEGTYDYSGPLYAIRDGFSVSFSELKRGAPGLVETRAEISLRFKATAYDAVSFPFPLVNKVVRRLSSQLQKRLHELLPGEMLPGIFITPHLAAIQSGAIRVNGEVWPIDAAASVAECEHGSFRNIKEPTLLYGYLCTPNPEQKSACVQILSRTLRNDKQFWLKDQADAALGLAIERTSSAEIRMNTDAGAFRKIGSPVLEVNNDHFPTAVFQRRIVQVERGDGTRWLALEEDTRAMRLEAIGCTRQSTVAAIRGEDKLMALNCVLEATRFDDILEAQLRASGKARALFSIAIKPNFMFAYDKRDVSTYTDPELVGHLVRRLRARGFAAIKVVEAQSTYGEYFDNRSVKEMAAYLGYNGQGYEIVDMTLDADEQRYLGPHLGRHPVSRAWREADFRISFAKNKTHAYAYFTLSLKNIYGALPLANKFREYHCNRDIYHTAMEYLAAFPVHFGLIDAWLSADGPFGVFAAPVPNQTRTILGGDDLVALDWVGASKMGLDPMLSKHVELAVGMFGKPEINLIGDANPYRPWLNVPAVLTLAARKGMDAEYHFGNLLYSIAAQMDETHFPHTRHEWYVRLLRAMTVPLRRTFFLRTGEEPTAVNRFFSRLFYHLGY